MGCVASARNPPISLGPQEQTWKRGSRGTYRRASKVMDRKMDILLGSRQLGAGGLLQGCLVVTMAKPRLIIF